MTTTETTKVSYHFHCGPDCYREHRKGSARCANIGHYDLAEMCVEDCTDHCAEKRNHFGI